MILNVVAGWTLFLGLLICTGAVVARIVILPRFYGADEALNSWALREAVRVGTIGAWITAFGVLAAFARQFVEFRDPTVPEPPDPT